VKICNQSGKKAKTYGFSDRTRVVRSILASGQVYRRKGPNENFQTKFLKFRPKRAKLATLVSSVTAYLNFRWFTDTFSQWCNFV